MKILLTGGSGFLGGFIKNKLTLHNNIITISKNNASINSDLSFEIPNLDYSNLVIHAAGKAHSVPKTEQERQDFYNVNVTGTCNLLRALEQAPALPAYFVFISSVAVYGLDNGNLINEQAPLQAVDPYGSSKIQAEKIIWEWCEKNKVICTILRLPLLAGPCPKGNLASMVRGIKAGYYFNIAGGTAKKSMVLAQDVAEVIPVVSKIGGIYNLTDRYHPDFSELSKLIARQLNKPDPLNIPKWIAAIFAGFGNVLGNKAPINTNKLSKITSNLTFDDNKAVMAFGWDPTSVLKGLKIK